MLLFVERVISVSEVALSSVFSGRLASVFKIETFRHIKSVVFQSVNCPSVSDALNCGAQGRCRGVKSCIVVFPYQEDTS